MHHHAHVALRAGLNRITFGNCIFWLCSCSSPVFFISDFAASGLASVAVAHRFPPD